MRDNHRLLTDLNTCRDPRGNKAKILLSRSSMEQTSSAEDNITSHPPPMLLFFLLLLGFTHQSNPIFYIRPSYVYQLDYNSHS
ncbi:hypothetical protein QVD17_15226 [Tagetes erecta]|uniref:Uncharacterized protein n=1 Tax=Tagetes erecta TaxID=13708 RepID=A0AAD8KST8_TARER|nr:hypothetical protein QVD17_15226 [Tagetes erecta]